MNSSSTSFPTNVMDLQHARKIIIGAGGTSASGWIATDRDILDVVDRAHFSRYWKPNSIDAFVAEHVWEHLTESEAKRATANCYEFLRPGGHLRIAVPDGFHPEPRYIEYVRPGGTGIGADDHKMLYTYQSMERLLEAAGFFVRLLEYWDEHGDFHFRDWAAADGPILRSKQYDPRNQDGSLTYTSLIVDAIKPASSAVLEVAD